MDGLTMDDYQLTLDRVVERAARFHPEREIVSRRPDRGLHRATYAAIAEEARRLAGGLSDRGIEPGDRVATLLWNQPEHLAVYFGIPAMGAVVHTLNPRLHPDELAYIVNHAEDRAIIVDETLLGVLESVRGARDFDQVIVVGHSEEAPAGDTPYRELIETATPAAWPTLDERQAAAMCYTSGTTGRPKGVTYSHRSAVLHCLGAALPDALDISSRDTILPVVPMFHANAWGLPYAAAFTGARLVLPGPHLDAESVLELLESERVTMTAGVPTVWMTILSALDAEPGRWDLSSLRRMVVGGAAVPQSMIEGFERHGLEVLQAWGMTETSPLGTVCHASAALEDGSSEQYAYRARQGVATPLVEIRARNEAGEVPWDDETMGELEVRGPWVAGGYHGGEGGEKFTEDGWFATGDVVTIDPGGCIKICDRAKDLVKSGGEWISSVDMENLLMAHPAVAEAAVIAVPDERWGERPLAVVVAPAEGSEASADQLREHLSAGFAKWQLPERFEYVDEIPRTATGKWKKTALRERFLG